MHDTGPGGGLDAARMPGHRRMARLGATADLVLAGGHRRDLAVERDPAAEAVLTMSPPAARRRILAESARALRPGGRLGLHELALVPDDLEPESREEVGRDLSATLRVGARPLTPAEWRALLAEAGLEVTAETRAPMALLGPGRLARDEGALGALRFAANALRDPAARRRVLAIRAVLRRHAGHLAAIALVAGRPAEAAS